ncbi:MAG TPA: DNA-binding response regulator [Desulfobacteraceae bacterium]|nr:DNA-binding response regulator [Desulfobacteraceae bacterium]
MTHPSDKTILIIDDDEDIVRTLTANLSLDGYRVCAAGTGREGIELAKETRPDLILLDLNLPDLDGIAICEILRREFNLPIIMLTARDTLTDKVLGLKSGADDYMVKPFEFLELSARITAIFNRFDRSMVKETREIQDLAINHKTRQVTLRGQTVKLTKTEFQLLELFTAHPDESLSRSFIEQQIWPDSQLYANSRALDVHIQRLRKKIEEQPDAPALIVTVAGVGYRFNTEGDPS